MTHWYPLFNVSTSLIMGGVAAYMAKTRGKNPFLWFFLGAFFGIFGFLFLIYGPKKTREGADKSTIDITPKFQVDCQNKIWYFLTSKNEQKGPMSFDLLKKNLAQGDISKNTYVWNESLKDWKPLSDFLITN